MFRVAGAVIVSKSFMTSFFTVSFFISSFFLIASMAHAQGATAPAQSAADEANIADLITASHILANEGVLDSFGHASVRSVQNPTHLFMPRAKAPALLTRADIVELDSSDCETVGHVAIKLMSERFIHCEVYKARPEIKSVIHTHDPAVLPFGLSTVPLQPVLAQSGFLPPKTPVFDVRDVNTEPKGMLINTAALGTALAAKLADNPVVLMRGHGDTVVGVSVKEATVFAIYTDLDARAQAGAAALGGGVIVLNDRERAAYPSEQRPDRPWDNFLHHLPSSDPARIAADQPAQAK
jgi:HCOMODA/2-hydroxy-3-carboxy-muconic semialdehyde decarboxylase